MEEFNIELKHESQNNFFGRNVNTVKFFYFQSFFFPVLGIIDLLTDPKALGLVYFVCFLLYGIGAFVQKNQNDKLHIILNNSLVDIYLSKYNQIKIGWNDISLITLNPISIHFRNKNDDAKHIDLGTLSYVNVKLLKSKLKEFAEAKNIELK